MTELQQKLNRCCRRKSSVSKMYTFFFPIIFTLDIPKVPSRYNFLPEIRIEIGDGSVIFLYKTWHADKNNNNNNK